MTEPITDDTKTFTLPLTAAPSAAHGTMDNFIYSESVEHGKHFQVYCDVHNTGESTGTFRLVYSINSTVVYTSEPWNIVAGGVTKHVGGGFGLGPAPDTGDSMTIRIRLIREA